jgi:hypothetical protein
MPGLREHSATAVLTDGSVLVAGGDLGMHGPTPIGGGFDLEPLASALRYLIP